MSNLEWLATFDATFSPRNVATLRPKALRLVGKRIRFQAAWLIAEEDGVPYVGQWACMPLDYEVGKIGWVPEEDLSDIVTVD